MTWYPVASSSDLVPRHVMQSQLLGQELAIWRADDGFVNVWENRCLHRGVRLSVGSNTGAELVCQYHGWRYASRSAGCTYIPAHPADVPAQALCNQTYPAIERYGLVWTTDDPASQAMRSEQLGGPILTLRPLPANASTTTVAAEIGAAHLGASNITTTTDGALHMIEHRALDAKTETDLIVFLQPVAPDRCVIRPVLATQCAPTERLETLRRYARRFADLVERVEAQPSRAPDVAVTLRRPQTRRPGMLGVTVAAKTMLTPDIVAFRLEPTGASLPPPVPGAHIDVQLTGGRVRQYSLTNGPAETDGYRIAVKREVPSRGGSTFLHDHVEVGDHLDVSAPRNGFALRRDHADTIFLAGGIGATPLVAMAQALDATNRDFSFHLFARSDHDAVFVDLIGGLRGRLETHYGLSPEETEGSLREILREPSSTSQIYVCGPGPMIEAVQRVAADRGWPVDAVHFEFFRNDRLVDAGSTFKVELARSETTVSIAAGETVLQAIRDAGIALDSSCEQGACRTCIVGLLDGIADHRDVCLTSDEVDEGSLFVPCVSRAGSGRLILDV